MSKSYKQEHYEQHYKRISVYVKPIKRRTPANLDTGKIQVVFKIMNDKEINLHDQILLDAEKNFMTKGGHVKYLLEKHFKKIKDELMKELILNAKEENINVSLYVKKILSEIVEVKPKKSKK